MRKLIVIESIYKNDRPEYLKHSIESIISQTFDDFKLLIYVDGPVSSELWTTIQSFTDKRIEVICNQNNLGLAVALNNLLSLCKGYEYIARMDADDISRDDRFEKQISYLESHPEVDVVGGSINEIDETGRNRGKETHYPLSPVACRKFFEKRNPVAHPTVMFRRRFFEKTGWMYPTDFPNNEDTCLWWKGYKHGCVIANLPDVLLDFRMTESMFEHRRNGVKLAKSQLRLRKMIASDLNYGMMAYVYAYAMFILMVSPSWILKIAYKILR